MTNTFMPHKSGIWLLTREFIECKSVVNEYREFTGTEFFRSMIETHYKNHTYKTLTVLQ